ncbi:MULTISPECIES: S-formylglutathione hydrolase [unclassified Microcoleus]|uniref:S-formylglutathione hydrolase n=1 Tax=unclassified Microcoleus TaxID=2642155 RepID=UPI0025F2C8E6|nr:MULTISPECIES: S-formylglutathione hydrolase [unclassified Microcoleus]
MPSNSLKLHKEHKSFGGKLGFYSHQSSACNSEMKFTVYQPPQAKSQPVPILYFLSGLTCTEENFMAKAGAQQWAAKYGLMLVAPDTSPRNTGIPGEADNWDLGSGAGFYVDATATPWNSHYRMYSYVVDELPNLIAANFPGIREKQGIFGHSMGGHGALICALKNGVKRSYPEGNRYLSVSAFAPICAPVRSPWGQKIFGHYLGGDKESWKAWDASELVLEQQYKRPILIDCGTDDSYLADGQLLPDVFAAACAKVGQPLTLRMQEGYDHSYYFVASFMEDHIRHHAAALCK